MEWWRWFYVYIRVMLAVLSGTLFLLVMWLIVWLPYVAVKWVVKKIRGRVCKR